jgi:hypothetical protein
MRGVFCGETAGWRCDRKVALLGSATLPRSTPYVGDDCVRTRCRRQRVGLRKSETGRRIDIPGLIDRRCLF